jgi:hypothetical protein
VALSVPHRHHASQSRLISCLAFLDTL